MVQNRSVLLNYICTKLKVVETNDEICIGHLRAVRLSPWMMMMMMIMIMKIAGKTKHAVRASNYSSVLCWSVSVWCEQITSYLSWTSHSVAIFGLISVAGFFVYKLVRNLREKAVAREEKKKLKQQKKEKEMAKKQKKKWIDEDKLRDDEETLQHSSLTTMTYFVGEGVGVIEVMRELNGNYCHFPPPPSPPPPHPSTNDKLDYVFSDDVVDSLCHIGSFFCSEIVVDESSSNHGDIDLCFTLTIITCESQIL